MDIEVITQKLCGVETQDELSMRTKREKPLPSVPCIKEVMSLLRELLFPGFFSPEGECHFVHYRVAANLDRAHTLLSEQIARGICFSCVQEKQAQPHCYHDARLLASHFFEQLPDIKILLMSDVTAAYEGDPAAKSLAETVFCYPSIFAMTHHRIAHALYKLKIPVLPRIISELAHSKTGIDIHPGAQIGENFFIDHGTGVVIGETCVVGRRCTLYQGVTLGALSFPKDSDGNPVKGMDRHPVLGDNVIVYAGATILGRVHIGDGSVIGGNSWVTEDLPPGSKVSPPHRV